MSFYYLKRNYDKNLLILPKHSIGTAKLDSFQVITSHTFGELIFKGT